MLTSLVNKIKTNLRLYAILVLIVALAIIGCHFGKKHAVKTNAVATNTVLKPNEAEKIIINEPEHKVTVVTSKGTTDSYFSNNTVITEDKNGKLSIYNPSWDFKLHGTVGIGMSNKPKLFVGVSPIGYKKLDLNIGLETDCQHFGETALNMSLGYNIHNATYLFIGVNNHKDVEGGLRFRF